MNRKKITALIATLAITTSIFTGCNGNKTTTEPTSTSNVTSSDTSTLLFDTVGISVEDMFTNSDKEIGHLNSDYSEINLSDKEITTTSESVSIDNGVVTISEEGTYVISGSISNGQIIVDAEKTDKIQLVLNGASINCDTSAAIYIKQADKVFLTLEKDTENTLSNKNDFVSIDENNIDSVIYSKDDLTLNGLGTLTINAAYGHGIVSKDDLVLTSGNYNITAASHGLQGKDSVRIAEGNLTINSGKDGIHSENTDDQSLGFIYIKEGTFNITSTNDGLDGTSLIQIDGGTFNMTTGGGSANASTDSNGNIREDWGNWNKGHAPNATFDPNTAPTKPNDSENGPGSLGENPAPDASTSASVKTPPSNVPGDGSNNNSETPLPAPDTHTSEAEGTQNNETDSTTEDTTASAKAVKADGSILINAGIFTIDSSDDSIHSNSNVFINDGTFSISSGDDGIHGDSEVEINGGSITILKSYEGIEGQSIEITGGSIDLVASDDGLNAAGGNDGSALNGRPGQNNFNSESDSFIKISGGNLNINANGDGIDANGNLYVSGGETYVAGPSNSGNGALDFDGTGEITGGILIATGFSGMALNFGNTSTQGSILYNASTIQSELVSITDSKGTVLASFTPDKEYNSVVISAPEIKSGGTYTLTMGSETQTIEMTSLIYGTGGNMGGGMGGHGGGKIPGGNKGTMPQTNGDNTTETPPNGDTSTDSQGNP